MKESANGTFVSLTDFRAKIYKAPSELQRLEQKDEVKISDTVFEVSWSDKA